MTHTPGPWVVDEMEAAQQPCIRTVEGTAIATAGNGEPWFRAKPKWVRDANLISAAPDMLDALEELLKRRGDFDDDEYHALEDGGLECERARNAVAVARAAIAKARGTT